MADVSKRRDEPLGPSRSVAIGRAISGTESSIYDLTLPSSEQRNGLRSRRPRLKKSSYIGPQSYHVVVVARHRESILVGTVAKDIALAIHGSAHRTSFATLAFCVMPDHVHMLMHGNSDEANLLRFVKHFKQTTSHGFIQGSGQRLWQQSFFDRVLRREESVTDVARYILYNPIEAGLAIHVNEWPFSGGTLFESEPDRPATPPRPERT